MSMNDGAASTPTDPGTPRVEAASSALPYCCVYASSVAACIGRNPHRPVAEAMMAAWERADPSGYQQALERNGTKTREDAVRELAMAHAGVGTLVDETARARPASSAEAAAAYGECSARLDEQGLDEDQRRLVDASLRQNLYTNYGNLSESQALEYIRGEMGIACRTDTTFHKACMGEVDGVPWYVGGKIDAISDDGRLVIEIKNRVNRLFYRPPPYEVLQLQTYLELLNAPHGVLVERLADAHGAKYNAIPMARDRAFWQGVVVPRLRTFVAFLVHLLRDEVMQDAFLKSDDPSSMVGLEPEKPQRRTQRRT